MIYSMMIQYDTGMTFFSMIVKDPLCRLVGSKKESCTRFIKKDKRGYTKDITIQQYIIYTIEAGCFLVVGTILFSCTILMKE